MRLAGGGAGCRPLHHVACAAQQAGMTAGYKRVMLGVMERPKSAFGYFPTGERLVRLLEVRTSP